jgi:hypothetical protein
MPSKARSASKIKPHGVRKIVGSESRQVNARTQVGNGESGSVGNSLSDPLSIFKHAADVKLGTIQLFWQSAPFYARHAAALSAEESE